MKQLSLQEKVKLDDAWFELNKAKTLERMGRRAMAQQVLINALYLINRLPRWFTDEEWKAQYDKLHRKLYTGL